MRRYKNMILSDKVFYIVVYSIAFAAMILVLYPLYFVIIASFSSPTEVATGHVFLWPKGLQLLAYKRVFANKNIWSAYMNTIVYTVSGTGLNIILTLLGAYVLSRRKLVGRKFFMLLIIFTMYFNGGLIPTYFNVRNLGLINTIWAMILPGAISVYNLIIARTFMASTIPYELQESALIDGCTHIRFFIHIIIPLSTALIGVLTLYYAVTHWNSYLNALMYMETRKKYPLQLILREILVQSKISSADMEEAAVDESAMTLMDLAESMKYALVIVASAPLLAVYPFLQKFFVKGVMIGSLKG